MARLPDLRAPFPWFGGKMRVADLVWSRFGDIGNYVEPFAGSLAVLLGSPYIPATETVNDKDAFIANFWRAAASDPDAVAEAADWPVNEADLHARHIWLVNHRQELTDRIVGDESFHDTMIAGWWVWGISSWIGGGWCSGNGPWNCVDGKIAKTSIGGVDRNRPHLGNHGQGVHVCLPILGNRGEGVHASTANIHDMITKLSCRLRRVRVCCGDWSRVVTNAVVGWKGVCGVLLDPPYDGKIRCSHLYACEDGSISHEVAKWAIEHGDDPMLRIALCGYEGEHEMPETWEKVEWKTQGGYSNLGDKRGKTNARLERVWFSPHCLRGDKTATLFDMAKP